MFPKFFATPKTLHNFINFHKFFIQTGSIRMKFNFGQKHLICHFPIQKSQLLHHPSAPYGPNVTTNVRIYISKIAYKQNQRQIWEKIWGKIQKRYLKQTMISYDCNYQGLTSLKSITYAYCWVFLVAKKVRHVISHQILWYHNKRNQ